MEEERVTLTLVKSRRDLFTHCLFPPAATEQKRLKFAVDTGSYASVTSKASADSSWIEPSAMEEVLASPTP